MILDGELAAGSRIVLRRLADQFGFSEMPVREALRMLQHEGLVQFQSHRGAIVTPISREAVIEGVSARMWLEILAVREATRLHTRATLAAAQQAFRRLEEAATSGDGLRFSEANRGFHEALEAPAGELVRSTIEDLWNRMWQARRTLSLFLLVPKQIACAQKEHAELLAAVERGDADAAGAVMQRHRESTLAAWRQALGFR
jgi:DNA-binding GntR family transcriptional regulator